MLNQPRRPRWIRGPMLLVGAAALGACAPAPSRPRVMQRDAAAAESPQRDAPATPRAEDGAASDAVAVDAGATPDRGAERPRDDASAIGDARPEAGAADASFDS